MDKSYSKFKIERYLLRFIVLEKTFQNRNFTIPLSFLETMKIENHTALVHTAAASNLGQMLVKICKDDGIPLVNIVRKSEQVELLKNLGAEYICNTSDESFMDDLVNALVITGATLGFDATGGGNNGELHHACSGCWNMKVRWRWVFGLNRRNLLKRRTNF